MEIPPLDETVLKTLVTACERRQSRLPPVQLVVAGLAQEMAAVTVSAMECVPPEGSPPPASALCLVAEAAQIVLNGLITLTDKPLAYVAWNSLERYIQQHFKYEMDDADSTESAHSAHSDFHDAANSTESAHSAHSNFHDAANMFYSAVSATSVFRASIPAAWKHDSLGMLRAIHSTLFSAGIAEPACAVARIAYGIKERNDALSQQDEERLARAREGKGTRMDFVAMSPQAWRTAVVERLIPS